MDKKENKRSMKLSPYFQYRPKKAKKSVLFSPTSSPSLRFHQNNMLKKNTGKTANLVRSQRICQDIRSENKDVLLKNQVLTGRTIQKTEDAPFKLIKQSKKKLKLSKNSDYFLTNQETINVSRQRITQTPKPKFDSLFDHKSNQDLLQSQTIDSQVYQKQIRKLQFSVDRYKAMHKSSLKKLRQVQQKAKQQQEKFQRVKQIYIQRINTLNRNLNSNKKNIGHLFTYEQMDKNIVPSKIILQLQDQEKSRVLRQLQNDLQILQQYYKSTQISMISEISLNSKPGLD